MAGFRGKRNELSMTQELALRAYIESIIPHFHQKETQEINDIKDLYIIGALMNQDKLYEDGVKFWKEYLLSFDHLPDSGQSSPMPDFSYSFQHPYTTPGQPNFYQLVQDMEEFLNSNYNLEAMQELLEQQVQVDKDMLTANEQDFKEYLQKEKGNFELMQELLAQDCIDEMNDS